MRRGGSTRLKWSAFRKSWKTTKPAILLFLESKYQSEQTSEQTFGSTWLWIVISEHQQEDIGPEWKNRKRWPTHRHQMSPSICKQFMSFLWRSRTYCQGMSTRFILHHKAKSRDAKAQPKTKSDSAPAEDAKKKSSLLISARTLGCFDPNHAKREVCLNASAPFKPDALFLSVTTSILPSTRFILKNNLLTHSVPLI